MEFTKMQGCGNDFIIINNMKEKLPVDSLNRLAKTLCTRRLSVGADGFIAVDYPTEGGDYKMRFYNCDGSLCEMCGNGARCVARYGFDNHLAGESQRIETLAGMVIGKRISEDLYQIKLNDPTCCKLKQNTTLNGLNYSYAYVELGDPGIPHIAVPITGLEEILKVYCSGDCQEPNKLETVHSLKALGKALRNMSALPKGANVNFYEITGADQVVEMTYERGVEDFTLACGTGTGSMVYALTEMDLVSGRNVRVSVPGGQLIIDVIPDAESKRAIYLTGLTNLIARGEIIDKE